MQKLSKMLDKPRAVGYNWIMYHYAYNALMSRPEGKN